MSANIYGTNNISIVRSHALFLRRVKSVPWAGPGSGFTLLFEALALTLIEREMPVNRVAEILKVNPQRIWTIFNHWISNAKAADDPSALTKLGVDETSTKKGHHYVTLGVDLDTSRVIHVTEGKGKATLHSIQQHLETKGVEKRTSETDQHGSVARFYSWCCGVIS